MTGTAVCDPPFQGHTYQHFADFLKDPGVRGPTLSPKRFSEVMHIDLQTLADQARVHRSTVMHAPGSRGVQNFLREVLRVIKAAADLNGDLNNALFWYRNEPLSAFGYRTAERLVSEGRADDLLRYTASIEAGVAG